MDNKLQSLDRTTIPPIVVRDPSSGPPATFPPEPDDGGSERGGLLICPLLTHLPNASCIAHRCMMFIPEKRQCSFVISARAALKLVSPGFKNMRT